MKRGASPGGQKSAAALEDEVACGTLALGPDHYGLNFVLRHWVAFAISRRSFRLLSKASALAAQSNISMDQILCGENNFDVEVTGLDRKMNYLESVLLTPARDQQTSGEPLQLSEIPNHILEAIECFTHEARRSVDHRWMLMREIYCGTSRHYVSPSFERDIASWHAIHETWKANRSEVKSLWLPTDENIKYSQGFIQQVSLHNLPNTPPKPTRTAKTRIRLKSSVEVEVECVVCLSIINLDHAYWYYEYFIPSSGVDDGKIDKKRSPADDVLGPISPDDLAFWENLDEFKWNEELDELLKQVEFGGV